MAHFSQTRIVGNVDGPHQMHDKIHKLRKDANTILKKKKKKRERKKKVRSTEQLI